MLAEADEDELVKDEISEADKLIDEPTLEDMAEEDAGIELAIKVEAELLEAEVDDKLADEPRTVEEAALEEATEEEDEMDPTHVPNPDWQPTPQYPAEVPQ